MIARPPRDVALVFTAVAVALVTAYKESGVKVSIVSCRDQTIGNWGLCDYVCSAPSW